MTVTAVDLECLKTLDKFVVRAQQHQQPQAATAHGPLGLGHLAGAPSSSLPGSNGGVDAGPTEQRSKHFYYQVLADSFAKDLPGVRRAEEQLAALAGELHLASLCSYHLLSGKRIMPQRWCVKYVNKSKAQSFLRD